MSTSKQNLVIAPEALTPATADFARVAQIASALGVGGMAAFLWSIEEVVPALKFQFTFGVVLAFLLAAAAAWMLWKNLLPAVLGGQNASAGSRRLWLLGCGLFLSAGTVLAFVRPLRHSMGDKAQQVVQGVLIALAVLTFVAWMFSRVVRYLHADEEQNAAVPPGPGTHDDTRRD
jgi:ABC-type Mn2+/Zn2+ transport system permease subunit